MGKIIFLLIHLCPRVLTLTIDNLVHFGDLLGLLLYCPLSVQRLLI